MINILLEYGNVFDPNSPRGTEYVFSTTQEKRIQRAAADFFEKTNLDPKTTTFELIEPYNEEKHQDIIAKYKVGPGKLWVLRVMDNGKPTNMYIAATRPVMKHTAGHQQTGMLHELAVGIFLRNPDASIKTPEKLVKLVKENFANVKKSDISSIVKINENIIKDARNLAATFLRKTGIKPDQIIQVYWTGRKNYSGGRFGPSDIIIVLKDGRQIGLSIKFGKGQLKNPSAKKIANIISNTYAEVTEKLEGERFLDFVYYMKPNELNNLVKSYVSFFINDPEFAEYKDILSKLKTWPAYSDFLKKYGDLASKMSRSKIIKSDKWRVIKNKFLVKPIADIFANVFESAEDKQLEPALLALYKEIFTIAPEPYYILSGSKHVERVPSEVEFENISKKLTFKAELISKGADFYLILYVGSREKQKPLLKIKVVFRWDKGQMMGDLVVKVAAPKFLVDREEVTDILFPLNPVEVSELADVYYLFKAMRRNARLLI